MSRVRHRRRTSRAPLHSERWRRAPGAQPAAAGHRLRQQGVVEAHHARQHHVCAREGGESGGGAAGAR